MQNNTEVVDAARDGEPDRYLAALLAPEPLREDLLALAAFAAEMRRIPSVVKEPMMGEIRLQWWRDAVEDGAAGAGTLTDALAVAMRRHGLPRPMLQAMTEARAFDLYDDPMPDEAALQGYLAKTETAPFALALRIVDADVPAALADHAARAYGMARLLVDLPQWLYRGRMPLPATLLSEVGVNADDLSIGQKSPGVDRLFDRLIAGIDSDAGAARAMARHLPRVQRLAVLPIATIPTYLQAFQTARRGPLKSMIVASPLGRITRTACAHWLGL